MLDKIANIFLLIPNCRIIVEGHTDNVGSEAYNLKLAQKRAESIAIYFVEKYDLVEVMFTPISYGESRPIASNKTDEGKSINRRVEILILED